MRIAWISNAPWSPTGYGQQTAEVTPLLKAAGFDVAILSNYGLAGTISDWGGIPVYPHGLDPYSNDLAPFQAQDWTHKNAAGWTISLYDSWTFKGPGFDDLNMAAWTPIDHSPVPPQVMGFFKSGKGKRLAIAMSRFGEQQLLNAGLERDRVLYAPHSINTRIFRPTPSTIRAELGIPAEAHLTMINAANKGNVPIRKCWPEMLLAWRTFAETRPDAYLYLHTEEVGVANGFNIPRYLEAIGAPTDRIKVVPQYPYKLGLPNTVLANLYSASDVLLSTSRGEGFGISVIEAQACGTPVITTDWTAQPELTQVGWRVDGQPEWDEHQLAYWKVPSVDLIIQALEEAYAARQDTERWAQMQADAVAFGQTYDTGVVFETYWKPILERLQAENAPTVNPAAIAAPGAANRAQRRAQSRARR
jgi:glycosyltransferase involved in cell wall biosynthesis